MDNSFILTKSATETQALGKELGKSSKNGKIILLFGDLGGGKTTFTQGFAKELGIAKNIISPTFIMMRTYDIPGNRIGKFYHLDLYRAASERDTRDIGLSEILENPKNIVVIEWADKLGKAVPKNRTELHFEYIDEGTRKVIVKTYE